MIYFAQGIDGGPVKIGMSGDPARRLAQLSRAMGRELRLLGVMDGGRGTECALIARFLHLRVRADRAIPPEAAETEWFEPGEDLIGFIRDQASVCPRPFRTIGVRASAQWADWLGRAAGHCLLDVAEMIDAALTRHARTVGFDEPRPGRLGSKENSPGVY